MLLMAAAQAAASPSAVLNEGAQVCGTVTVTSPDTPKAKNGRFSAAKVLDVEFRTTVARKVEGAHRLRFRVMTPKGHLYQELSVPFVANASGRTKVTARLPVGGTSISTSSLYGTWRVQTHLDDFMKPCVGATKFTITK
jgi:hypothetical protein